MRNLSDIGSSVAVNKVVPVKRYFRSGSEMERQVRRVAWRERGGRLGREGPVNEHNFVVGFK